MTGPNIQKTIFVEKFGAQKTTTFWGFFFNLFCLLSLGNLNMENPKRKRDAVEEERSAEESLPCVEVNHQHTTDEGRVGVVDEDEAVEGEWNGGGLLFECMPVELCQEVFDLLKTKDLFRLTRVSRWMRGRVLTLIRSYRVRSTEADDVRSSLVYYRRLEDQAAHTSVDDGDKQDHAEDEKQPHHKKRRKEKKKVWSFSLSYLGCPSLAHSTQQEKKHTEHLKSRDDYSVTLGQFLDLIASECPRLRSLDLSFIKRPAQHLAQAIMHLPSSLTSLNLSYSGLEGSGNLEHLHRVVPSLTLLDVSHCSQLSVAAFKKLPDELTTLKARGIRKFDSSMFASLPSTLTSLDLRDCSLIEWPSETSKLPSSLRTLRISIKDRPSHISSFGWFQMQSPAERTCPFSHVVWALPEGLQRLDLSQSTCFLSVEVASLPRAMHSLSFHKCSGVRSESTCTRAYFIQADFI